MEKIKLFLKAYDTFKLLLLAYRVFFIYIVNIGFLILYVIYKSHSLLKLDWYLGFMIMFFFGILFLEISSTFYALFMKVKDLEAKIKEMETKKN